MRQVLERYPEHVQMMVQAHPLTEPTTPEFLSQRWQDYLSSVNDESSLHSTLRQFRREVQFRIIWRDLLRWADLAETVAATSAFADTCLEGLCTGFTRMPVSSLARPMDRTR